MKRVIIITFTILLVLTFTSCTAEDIYIDDVEDEAPLSMYLVEYVDYSLADNIRYYEKVTKDHRGIDITWFKFEEIENMYTRILNEISAGKGPDIIVINPLTDKYIDIHKVSGMNAFADMDILIDKSESFDFNNYNKIALDAGIINDKRIFIPLTYKVEYMIGVEECFEYNNLKIPNELTFDVYCDLLEEYYQNTNKQAMLGIDPLCLLSYFIEIGKPIEKNSRLERLFELLKIEDQRFIEPVKKKSTNISDVIDYYDSFISNNHLFLRTKNWGWNQFRHLHAHYNIIENMFESNTILFKQPFIENSPIRSYTENGLAININSRHKNEALKMVQFILSEGPQSRTLITTDLPINKKAYKNEVQYFSDGYSGIVGVMFDINESKIPEKMRNDFIAYIESAETCEYIGQFRYIYNNVINQSIEDYYNNHLTFDELIDEMNNKLSIYYSE